MRHRRSVLGSVPPIVLVFWGGLLGGVGEPFLHAQGRIDAVVGTGLRSPIVEKTFRVPTSLPINPTSIMMDVGFQTEAALGVSDTYDSVSVILMNPVTGSSGVLAYLSPGNLALAPWAPGYVAFRLETIAATAQLPIDVHPGFSVEDTQSYHIALELPPAFQSTSLQVLMQLLDNQDDDRSIAWVANTTLVPEPSTWAILSLGALTAMGIHHARRTRRSSDTVPGAAQV